MNKTFKRGTTLLEIMIALFIMAAAMIPIASIMGYGGRATSKDSRRIVAIQLLDKTLRQLLQEPFDQIPVGANVQASFNGVRLGNVVSDQGESYAVTLNSQYENPVNFSYCGLDVNRPTFQGDNPIADDFLPVEVLALNDVVLRLEVTVQWNEQTNLPVSVSAITYRANFQRRNG